MSTAEQPESAANEDAAEIDGGGSSRRRFLTGMSLLGLGLPLLEGDVVTAGVNAPGPRPVPDRSLICGPVLPPPPPGQPPAYDARLGPVNQKIVLHTSHRVVEIAEGIRMQAWTFDGTVPGPILHVRKGERVDVELHNDAPMPHSIDLHAARVNPEVAFASIAQGQVQRFSFTPQYAGAFLYHCGTPPVLLHMGSGMVGAIIVDPEKPLPPAREFVIVQSEFYVTRGLEGAYMPAYDRMLAALPDYVVFNGRGFQYVRQPLVVKRGDLVRFHVVNAGPSNACAFHLVGEQFDRVYLAEPPGNAITGVQTFSVEAGSGMIFELTARNVGRFPFVTHKFGHGEKGAMGLLEVQA